VGVLRHTYLLPAARQYPEAPGRLQADLDRADELERGGDRGDPDREAQAWAQRLSEADAKRARFQHAYAEGVMELQDLQDLQDRLTELEEERAVGERELAALRGRAERVRELERDRHDVLNTMMGEAPDVLDSLDPEERHRFYKMLRIKVHMAADDSMEITGVFPEPIRSGPVCTFDASR
jgi:hypothetical protein